MYNRLWNRWIVYSTNKDSVHQPKDSVSPLLSYTLEVVCRLLLPGRVVEGGCGAGLVLVDCCHTLHTNTIASRLQTLVSRGGEISAGTEKIFVR